MYYQWDTNGTSIMESPMWLQAISALILLWWFFKLTTHRHSCFCHSSVRLSSCWSSTAMNACLPSTSFIYSFLLTWRAVDLDSTPWPACISKKLNTSCTSWDKPETRHAWCVRLNVFKQSLQSSARTTERTKITLTITFLRTISNFFFFWFDFCRHSGAAHCSQSHPLPHYTHQLVIVISIHGRAEIFSDSRNPEKVSFKAVI